MGLSGAVLQASNGGRQQAGSAGDRLAMEKKSRPQAADCPTLPVDYCGVVIRSFILSRQDSILASFAAATSRTTAFCAGVNVA